MTDRKMSIAVCAAALAWAAGTRFVTAQARPGAEQTPEAILVVEGEVRAVYRNIQGPGVVVEIEVSRAEARRAPAAGARVHFPAPGDFLFVHAADGGLPASGSIQAHLQPRPSGGWQGAGAAWFSQTGGRPQELPGDSLGISFTPITVNGKPALKVTSVERHGAAGRSGLEVGDVIVGVNGKGLSGPEQLEQLARRGEAKSLIVVDVNTGRYAQVALNSGAAARNQGDSTDQPASAPDATSIAGPSLGISAEAVTIGQRTALKVVSVQEKSPAAQAGLEPGDILVSANNAPLTSPEQLAAVIRKSGPELTLTVRDVRSGRDVKVAVQLQAPLAEQPLPGGLPQPANPTFSGGVGVVTELAFFDSEAAVKITEVEPGSPAARAGLKPGLLIVQAGGKIVLHPNDLRDIERTTRGALRLVVVDPSTNRKNNVTVNLDR